MNIIHGVFSGDGSMGSYSILCCTPTAINPLIHTHLEPGALQPCTLHGQKYENIPHLVGGGLIGWTWPLVPVQEIHDSIAHNDILHDFMPTV